MGGVYPRELIISPQKQLIMDNLRILLLFTFIAAMMHGNKQE